LAEATAASSIYLRREGVKGAADEPPQEFAERIVKKQLERIEMLCESFDDETLDERQQDAAVCMIDNIEEAANAKLLKVAEKVMVSLADVVVTRERYLSPWPHDTEAIRQQIEAIRDSFSRADGEFDDMPTLENFQKLVSAGRQMRDLWKEIRG